MDKATQVSGRAGTDILGHGYVPLGVVGAVLGDSLPGPREHTHIEELTTKTTINVIVASLCLCLSKMKAIVCS